MASTSVQPAAAPTDKLDGDAVGRARNSIEALRVAIDGIEFGYRASVSLDVWRRCEGLAAAGEPLALEIPARGKRKATVVVALDSWRAGAATIEFKDDVLGVGVRVHGPLSPGAARAHQAVGVRVSITGRAFAGRVRGRALVKQIAAAVEAALFPEAMSVKEERRRIREVAIVDELHLACDVVVRGAAAERVRASLFAGGNLLEARDRFITRAKHRGDLYVDEPGGKGRSKRYAALRSRGRGLSVAIGRDLRVVTYEKDRCVDNWAPLSVTLAHLGWNVDDRVVRTEFQIKPRYRREIELDGQTLDAIPLRELVGRLPQLYAKLGERVRHVVPGEGRRERWPVSPYWQAVVDAAPLLGPGRTGSAPLTEAVALRDARAVERREAMLVRNATWLVQHAGRAPGEVVYRVAHALGVPAHIPAEGKEPSAVVVASQPADGARPAAPTKDENSDGGGGT